MAINRLGKKLLKLTGIILGILVVIFIAFHFWFINHAKDMLESTVSSKSNGKLKLKIEKLHYNYFTQKMVLDKAVFVTLDTSTASSAYNFEVPQLRLSLKALLPLVFQKKLLIDSLYLQSPHITVTTLRYSKDTLNKKKEEVSIPQEMGKVYRSIQDALTVLQVNRFQIEDGKFSLVNKIVPGQLPLNINNIHFHIDNLQVDSTDEESKQKILFSDNVVLRSNHQNILFPDKRHRISFSDFRINLQSRLVEFDSCTIEATRKDTSESSFKVFFDKLSLTNIDFDTLYHAELIKADSVYCVNPKFMLNVKMSSDKASKKDPPKLEKIIEQLTGDMQLGFVVVQNAEFDIKTTKNGNPNSFTFSNNNFEMQGLRIDQDEAKPITVKSFAMAIRNYENFIKDSSYSVKFDSVIFKDDQITLSNFLFNKLDNGKILNTFSVPRFSLHGLSWDDLVFEKKLKANLATMYQPHIIYTVSGKKKSKAQKQSVFESLSDINDYMDLQQLDIVNGDIDLRANKNLRLQLDNATLSVQSHSLLTSTKLAGIKSSLTSLNFDRGRIKAGDLTINLNNILYRGSNGEFAAGNVIVDDAGKNIYASLNNVSVKEMVVNEINGDVTASGISWQKADIKMKIGRGKGNKNTAVINLKDVQGQNSSFTGQTGGKNILAKFNTISFDNLQLKPGNQPLLTALAMQGSQLSMKDKETSLNTGAFEIADNKMSTLRKVSYTANNSKMEADIQIPSITFTPDVQSLINGDIETGNITLTKPVINLHLAPVPPDEKKTNSPFPIFNIAQLKIIQPQINFTSQKDSNNFSLSWDGKQNGNNFLLLNGLHTTNKGGANAVIDNLQFYLNNFLISTKGKNFATGEGKIAAQLSNVRFTQPTDTTANWQAKVENLDATELRMDSIRKDFANFYMQQGEVKNMLIGSAFISDMRKVIAINPSFQLHNFTGHYYTAATRLNWYNANFSRGNNIFSLDSFFYSPALPIDSFLATKKYQTDYIKASTGAIRIGPIDVDTYLRDTILNIRHAAIDKAFLSDYKDKQMPFNGGLIKPLPVDMIKRIGMKLKVDSVTITNGNVEYTEVNEKSGMAGTIPVNRLNVNLFNVKNYNLTPTDSLVIRANGYLMDTVWVRLRLKESYTDTLGGFMMTVRLKPGDLTILNPALMPLANVKLLSGQLDTLSMRAVGREYLAFGSMNMYYRDLKIQLLKDGKEIKKTLFTKVVTFVANTFVLKKNNSSRTGTVFFIRQRDRSAINYLIKIALSGMSSSVGIKKNKKLIRKYKRELEKRNLPPIDFE